MIQVTLILALILAGVLALFGAQNTEAVTLHFLWFTARAVPLPLALLGGAVMGALLSVLVGLPGRLRRAFTAGDLKRQNVRQETQIAHLHAAADGEAHALQKARQETKIAQLHASAAADASALWPAPRD
jgi:uncharacterized integral membrane protein